MEPTRDDLKTIYRNLQREVREAVDRCADSLAPQVVPTVDAAEPEVALEALLLDTLRLRDGSDDARRVLMVVAESARRGDAVALFLVERMAARHALSQLDELIVAEHLASTTVRHASEGVRNAA